MLVLVQYDNFVCAYLINTNKVDRKCFFARRIWCVCSKGRYNCPILPTTLIKLSTMIGFKGGNLLCVVRFMSFFKVLNSSGKHCNLASFGYFELSLFSIFNFKFVGNFYC